MRLSRSPATGATGNTDLQTLPKDGSWAKYYFVMKTHAPQKKELSGTFTLKSVGTATENGKGHGGKFVNCVAFSPNGKLLASGGGDKTVRLWDVKTGKLLRTLKGHVGTVTAVAFSPDGKHLASGGRKMNVLIWNIASAK